MKKYLLTTTLILLLAAACNNQPASPGASQGGTAQVQPVQNQPAENQQAQPSQAAQAQPQPTPTDETASWKTYKNVQYGFEIQLPSDWQVEAGKYEGVVTFTSAENFANINAALQKNQSEAPPSNITFLYFDDITKQAASEGITLTAKTLDNYVKLSENNFFNPQKITFAGQTAYRGREAGMTDIDAIWFQRGNHLYKIWLQSNVGMDKLLSDKILATFKFSN